MASETTSSEHESSTPDLNIILELPNNITVRRYRPKDAQSLANNANNKRVLDNLRNGMPNPYTVSDSEKWIQRCADPSIHVPSGPWTGSIDTRSTGPALPTDYCIAVNNEACGTIGLAFGSPTDIYAHNAEVGYWLGVAFWDQGVMGTVVPAFVAWTWETFGFLVRLNASVYEGNKGSLRCLEKAGFSVEGRKRWGFVKNGKLGTEVLLGMLRPGAEQSLGEEDEVGRSLGNLDLEG